MAERWRRWLIANGALVFLVGLLAGFPFAFFEIGKITLWPLPGAISVSLPGDVRAWRMAHLEGILNGLTLFAVAAVLPAVHLRDREQAVVGWSLLVTAWGNTVASLLGPLSGGRGLEFGGGVANSLMYLLFVAAVVAVILAMLLICRGALRRS
jgi:hypothetical protein